MNNQVPFFNPFTFPNNQNNYEKIINKLERLEKNIRILENRINKLENQNNKPNIQEEPRDMYMI